MAATAVSVFVDDAVRGDLPDVCVKTGQPSDLVIRTSRAVGGGSGPMWLLFLLGPIGVVALILVSVFGHAQEYLTVRLPYTQAAWDHERRIRRSWIAMIFGGAAALIIALLAGGPLRLLWVTAGLGLLLGGFLVWSFSYFEDVGVSLDASRRWVTLTRVHPAFARAVEARSATAGPRR
jgi:hypothetical protein